jgi:hypothetical protein
MNDPEPMNEEDLRPPCGASEAPGADAPEPPPPEAEPEVFWGYGDLMLFAGLTVASVMFSLLLAKAAMAVFHLHAAGPVSVAVLLLAQMAGYAVLFGALRLMFHVQYDRPFWKSLGWAPLPVPAPYVVAAGAGTAMAAILAGAAIHLPQTENQMSELLQQGTLALVLMTIFGVGIAPLCEELAFRGFLQPLLARSFGAPAGILMAGVAFGLLHFREYGNSWRHALLLSGAGACFGWMRHASKSTKASVVMHASYNGLLFLLLAIALIAERNPHH